MGLLQPRGTFSWGSAPIFKQNAVNLTSTLTASPGATVGATVPSTLRLPLSEFAILKSATFCTVPFSASIICVMPCTPHETPLSEGGCGSSYLHLCDGPEDLCLVEAIRLYAHRADQLPQQCCCITMTQWQQVMPLTRDEIALALSGLRAASTGPSTPPVLFSHVLSSSLPGPVEYFTVSYGNAQPYS